VPDAFVGVYTSHGFASGTGTDDDGTYTVSGLTPGAGPYVVCVTAGSLLHGTATGFASQCYDGSASGQPWTGSDQSIPAGAASVPVTADAVTGGINAALTAGGAITGKIQANGGLVADGFAEVFDANGGQVGGAGTSASGVYRINGLTPTAYTVCFGGPDSSLLAQCFKKVPWDGDSRDLPDNTTPVGVTRGTVVTVNATLLPSAA
jgi:hypothetical protein